jgi:hypothetical protein
MSNGVRGFLTVLVAAVLGLVAGLLINLAADEPLDPVAAILMGAIFGLLYGLESGILLSYNLGGGMGWLQLIVDFTWSLLNTVFGFVFGNLIYIFDGNPSRTKSKGKG